MYILEWKEKLKIGLCGENEEVLGKEEESKWTICRFRNSNYINILKT